VIRITIDVTRQDLAAGIPGEPCTCPIAVAALRAMPFLTGIWVDETHIELDAGYGPYDGAAIPLPPLARESISRIDAGDAVEPFSFDIDVPDELIPAGSLS